MREAEAPLRPEAATALPVQAETPLGSPAVAAAPDEERRPAGRFVLHAVRVLVLVAAIGLWDLFTRTGVVSDVLVPGPWAVARAVVDLVSQPWFPPHLQATLVATAAGFGLAAVVGIPLGVLLANSRLARRILFPYVVIMQVIPKIALAPLLIVWVGPGVGSKIVLAAAIAVFPALINTMLGIESVDEDARLLLRSLGSSRWQMLTKLQLPTSAPAIVAGLESSLTIVLIGVIAGEFISAEAGLGTLLITFQYNFQIAPVFATMLVIGALGLAVYVAFVVVARRLLRRRPGLGIVV